jgi:Subtilase family
MTTRTPLLAVLALLSAAAVSRATAPYTPSLRFVATPGIAGLRALGGRSAQQRQSALAGKLDATLADLTRHSALIHPERALADLHALNPAARFKQPAMAAAPMVLIDAVTRGDPRQLQAALEGLGLQQSALYSNDVGGWLPVNRIDAATALPELHSIRAAMSRTHAGAVTSQGDFAQSSDVLRADNPSLTGAGITVGILSDSYNCYAVYEQPGSGVPAGGLNGFAPHGFLADAAQDVASGDLPSGIDVLQEADCLSYGQPDQLPYTDEGRAMLQIVHDVAPGASLAFYAVDTTEADFANGITRLAAAGAKVEADDTQFFDEPFFQDGVIAQAVDTVEAQGVAYFSAAGNNAAYSYENTAPMFATLSSSAPNSGEALLNFDTSGATTTTALPVTIPALYPGEFMAVVVEWDQPYVSGAPNSGGATSQVDLCVTGASGANQIIDEDGNAVVCTGPNATGVDPVQVLIIFNPADSGANTAVESLNLMIGLASGSPAPARVKLALEADGAPVSINRFATNSATLQGHPGAAGAFAVGAAFFALTARCGVTPAMLEVYSSLGGAPILFDSSGTRLAAPLVRQKPDAVGPDGINTTFFGETLAQAGVVDASNVSACDNNASYPNFFGTSAATPHVAGAAALLLQSDTAVTPAQVYSALQSSALAMGATQPNFSSGYGFIQADAALALLPQAATSTSSSAHKSSGGGGFGAGTLLLLAALAGVRTFTRRQSIPARWR